MIIIPKYRGRLLNEVKRYPNFILFEDPKTKVKISYTYQELGYKTSQMKGEQNAENNGETIINIWFTNSKSKTTKKKGTNRRIN